MLSFKCFYYNFLLSHLFYFNGDFFVVAGNILFNFLFRLETICGVENITNLESLDVTGRFTFSRTIYNCTLHGTLFTKHRFYIANVNNGN